MASISARKKEFFPEKLLGGGGRGVHVAGAATRIVLAGTASQAESVEAVEPTLTRYGFSSATSENGPNKGRSTWDTWDIGGCAKN
jgi:hypothetical protein